MEYRVYNKINCTLFDMIGRNEPDQTKGLGYVLAKSPVAMKLFLQLLPISKKISYLLSLRWVVECEQRVVCGTGKVGRTDIVIRFYDHANINTIIIIEAKDINGHVNPISVNKQLQSYVATFVSSGLYTTANVLPVMLTNIAIPQNSASKVCSITWMELILQFEQYVHTNRKSSDSQLIGDFVNYLIKI